jgi:hypothetical protein
MTYWVNVYDDKADRPLCSLTAHKSRDLAKMWSKHVMDACGLNLLYRIKVFIK